MRVCGFKFQVDGAFFASIEGTRTNPVLIDTGKIKFPEDKTPGEFVVWAEKSFGSVLQAQSPKSVTYKLATGLSSHDQIFFVYFGMAQLVSQAEKHKLTSTHVAPQKLGATSIGLAKSTPKASLNAHTDNLFPQSPPDDRPWNNSVREAARAAWLHLEG